MRIVIIGLLLGFVAVCLTSIFVVDLYFTKIVSIPLLLILLCVMDFLIRKNGRGRGRAQRVGVVGVLVLLLLAIYNAPLKVTFSIYQSEFNALSDRVVKGESVVYPVQIGPFSILGGGVRDGSNAPYLMTNRKEFEIDAFVKDPGGRYFNLWSLTELNSEWSYVEED